MSWIHDAWKMIGDLQRTSPFMRVWGPALNAPKVLGGLIFINRFEGVLILISCVASVLVAAQIHKRVPFSRLTSLVHVVWVPLFPELIRTLTTEGLETFFGIWLGYVVVTMGVSLFFDARNIVLYLIRQDAKFEGADA